MSDMMNNMMGGGWLAMLFGILLILVVIAAIVIAAVYFVSRAGDRGREGSRSGRDGGLDILRKRFARGEIDRDEFEERRRALRRVTLPARTTNLPVVHYDVA